MQTITGGRAVVNILKAEGVTTVFGIPGGHTLPIYDALFDTQEIRHVLVRHEQAAASMAAAYAQLSGEPGVCIVTAGPGATNFVTGIAEAFIGATPMVAIAGRGSTLTTFRGDSQEARTERIFEPITKWSVRVDQPEVIPEVLRQAFAIARSGKPGPVYIDMPRDVLMKQVPFADYKPAGRPQRIPGNPDQVAAAARALLDARRPILIAGGGVLAAQAADEVRTLAELLAIPVLTSLAGRGSIADDHPLSVGGLGCHRNALSRDLLGETDCAFGIATRFEQMETNWRPGFVPPPDATYIQLDIDPTEIGRGVAATIGIVGDAKLVLAEIIRIVRDSGPALAPGRFRDQPRTVACAAALARIEEEADTVAASMQTPIHPLRVIRAAREAFPREATVAFDVGVLAQQMAGAAPYFKVYEPRSTIVCSSFYGMGFSSMGAPAARLVRPDWPALCFVGDGSFQMAMNVLPTAAEEKLCITWCILNDRALGSIRDIQELAYNARFLATDFAVQPDFAKIAEACGCYGERIEDPANVAAALKRALAANERGVPAVLDFIVAQERILSTTDFYPMYKNWKKP
jgi:acetolactate synthase I/II/III large subunit